MSRVTVVGMGHGGTTVGADLSLKGHEVTLLKTSDTMHGAHHDYLLRFGEVAIVENESRSLAKLHRVTSDFSEALTGAEVVIIFVQTNYHEQLLKRIAPYLSGSELVLFEPGYLSTAYVLKNGMPDSLTVAEATSSPIDCRITAPGEVHVSFRNVANHVGVYPQERRKWASDLLDQLGYNWIHFASPIEAALHNPNLIVHTVGAIMSFPRIEYTSGNYWMYREVFTPTVWNLVEALDAEKNAVLAQLGFAPLAYVEACKQRNSLDQTRDAKSVFFDYAQNSSVAGPSEVRSRYVTEDVPEGLVLLESLGQFLELETPVCSALIDLSSAALGLAFRGDGRNIDRLGRENLGRLVRDAPVAG